MTAPDASTNGWIDRATTDQLEAALAAASTRSSPHADDLRRYFGDAEFEEMQQLASEAKQQRASLGRLLILPGIMGSSLGSTGTFLTTNIWLNPVSIARGGLFKLTLPSPGSDYFATDVLPLYYLKLKLVLQWRGYDVDYYYYDWRRGLDYLGKEFAMHLDQSVREDVHLVCHSMGGLVARSAAFGSHSGGRWIKRVVQLGTPNRGSFEPIQVLLGRSSTVTKVGAADLSHTTDELIGKVFNSFDGLYQLMPNPSKFARLDLFKKANWPDSGRFVKSDSLLAAKKVLSQLPDPDDRFSLIAGCLQKTIVDITAGTWAPVFGNGDGTVPLDFARVDGLKEFFIAETHGDLPRNRTVAEAAFEILSRGTTALLSRTPLTGTLRSIPETRSTAEPDLRALHSAVYPISPGSGIKTPVGSTAATPTGSSVSGMGEIFPDEGTGRLKDVEIGRRMQRLDIELINADITTVKARAYVVAMFDGVRPTSGAVHAIDQVMEGAILEAYERRVISTAAGQMFLFPVGVHPLPAEFVVLVGLGAYDQFTSDIQRSVSENLVRTLLSTGIDEFATVLLGTGSVRELGSSLGELIRGLLAGLKNSTNKHAFRRIVLCEYDDKRYVEIRNWLYGKAASDLFDETRLVLHELEPPKTRPTDRAMVAEERPPAMGPRFYVMARASETDDVDILKMELSILPESAQSTVFLAETKFSNGKLIELQKQMEQPGGFARHVRIGEELAALVLGRQLMEDLTGFLKGSTIDKPLVVIQNGLATRVPWELLHLNGKSPAITMGLSRQLVTRIDSFANWSTKQAFDDRLDVLLIVNPTMDLPGADREGANIQSLMAEIAEVRVTRIQHAEATKKRIVDELRSGGYDVLHYAGHASFNAANPAQSGINCANGERLTGEDLQVHGVLPGVVFMNACESARVRKAPANPQRSAEFVGAPEENASMAEAFLRAGVKNYLGTYWPVGDAAAKTFAKVFYENLVAGSTVGHAIQQGRSTLFDQQEIDCFNYINFGDPFFRVKIGR